MSQKKSIKFITRLCVLAIILSICYILLNFLINGQFDFIILEKGLVIKSIDNVHYENDSIYVSLETYNAFISSKMWCISTSDENVPDFNDENWQAIVKNKCNLKIHNGDKYLYIKYSKNVSEKYLLSDYISCVTNLSLEKDNYKLIKGETVDIILNLETVGLPDTTINYIIEDEKIVKIENNQITGLDDGKTTITISDNYGHYKNINVEVTSLITLPQINNSKPFISNKQYTEEEAKILDEYLFYQIDEAGYQTRAGVVAAARFLTLEFKYRIPYFLENGRVTHFNHQRSYADGEGRYYHRGLYLSTDKFKDLEKIYAGPAMWGGYIREYSTDNGMMKNGLDCSGFVCWCLKNGGFDFGDIGAGLSEGLPTLSDRGVSQRITMSLLESKTVKAGDLIGFDGHIGIIIGVDNENEFIYVADTLYHSKGTWVTKYTYKGLVNSIFTHIYDYTDEYKEEGNYKSMW